jgi:hypothetical protein
MTAFESVMFDPGDANDRARAVGIIITTTSRYRPIAFEKLHAAA